MRESAFTKLFGALRKSRTHHSYQNYADGLYIPMSVLAITVLAVPPILMLVAGAFAVHRIELACRAVAATETDRTRSTSQAGRRVSPGIGRRRFAATRSGPAGT
jgi:hypothetical protein